MTSNLLFLFENICMKTTHVIECFSTMKLIHTTSLFFHLELLLVVCQSAKDVHKSNKSKKNTPPPQKKTSYYLIENIS